MKAMIFAAGLGTRLKPVTDSIPKALVELDGVTLLERVMRKLLKAGIDEFVINVHHFPQQIIDFLNANSAFGASVFISDEQPEALETGGGVLHARPLLLDGESCGRFLAHNVDIISNLDISAFETSLREDALSTLVVSERPTSRYFLFDDDMRLVGWTNVATGEVRSPFGAIDPARYRRLAFAGIHILSEKVFAVMDSLGFDGRFSIVDFYLKAAGEYPIYGYAPAGLKILDVGKPATLLEGHSFLEEIGA